MFEGEGGVAFENLVIKQTPTTLALSSFVEELHQSWEEEPAGSCSNEQQVVLVCAVESAAARYRKRKHKRSCSELEAKH